MKSLLVAAVECSAWFGGLVWLGLIVVAGAALYVSPEPGLEGLKAHPELRNTLHLEPSRSAREVQTHETRVT